MESVFNAISKNEVILYISDDNVGKVSTAILASPVSTISTAHNCSLYIGSIVMVPVGENIGCAFLWKISAEVTVSTGIN